MGEDPRQRTDEGDQGHISEASTLALCRAARASLRPACARFEKPQQHVLRMQDATTPSAQTLPEGPKEGKRGGGRMPLSGGITTGMMPYAA